ncbi:MAG: hypothetical protein JSS65_03805 [Armatimonadetes bacterium]|nr:hypothetical protein [Armatimonadota bacterium]
MGKAATALIAISCAVAVTAGCVLVNNGLNKGGEPAGQAASETLAQSADTLKPQAVPYTKGNLIYQGSVVPVDIKSADDGKTLKLEFIVDGETTGSETYTYDATGFRFAGTEAELYEPALPLVHYPFKSEDPARWTGEIKMGDHSYPAEAEIKAKKEDLNITAGHFNTYLVEVQLSFDGGAPEKSKRRLRFWFDPGKGVVKRELGLNSSREPRTDAEKTGDE